MTILCACLQAVAQEPVRDSTEVLAEPVAMQAKEPIPPAVQPEPVKPATRSVDTTVYQGVIVRLDIANPIFELARSNWHTYAVEAAVSVRLKYRLFPTIELGYAGQFRQEKDATTPKYNGQGEYVRLGMDINPLKKHPERRSVMLVGVRAKLPIIPIAAYCNFKYYFGGDYPAEVDAGNMTLEVGGGFAL